MMVLRPIFYDQLSHSLASLQSIDPSDVILFCEVMQEARHVQHHPKKLALWFSAMRHFAEELRQQGHQIRYIKLDDPENQGNLRDEFLRAAQALSIQTLIVTEPSEYRLKCLLDDLHKTLSIERLQDDRFLCSIEEFKLWASGRKQLRMEYFYRMMRQKHHLLMEQDQSPSGGQWNFDHENRKPPSAGLRSIQRLRHPRSLILKEVLEMVEHHFSEHFGDLHPFYYAITREQALLELDHFIEHILPVFGDHQDAMLLSEAYLHHSLLASYINIGLLLPLEICQKAEHAYRLGRVPINSAEGFIRQILGWREFVRGIYWLKMPAYASMNALDAQRALPNFYWTGQTEMACIREVIGQTRVHAYSHHIQRLMVTGNFALLAGLDPKEVQDWYLAVYSDAYEWVEMPNTVGMALFADGGILASKPYAASGQYIHKMSNFCQSCRYKVKDMLGPDACPLNALYWNFLAQHQKAFAKNPRLSLAYQTWHRFSQEKQAQILKQAQKTLQNLEDQKL